MSADRDRGIRRQKQKRAKVMKKQAREQRETAVSASGSAKVPEAKQAA